MSRVKITSTEQALDLARSQGWSVEYSGGGHWKCKPADRSKGIVTCASTPSDHRSLKNTVALLRRSGLDLEVSMPTASPEVRGKKLGLAKEILRLGNKSKLPLAELADMLGESVSSLKRWTKGSVPRRSEAKLREFVADLLELSAPVPAPVPVVPVVPAPVKPKLPPRRLPPSSKVVKKAAPVPAGRGNYVLEVGVRLDFGSLSVEKLAEVAAECVAELARRAGGV